MNAKYLMQKRVNIETQTYKKRGDESTCISDVRIAGKLVPDRFLTKTITLSNLEIFFF